MRALDLDPVKVREGLANLKRRRVPFDRAWLFVAGPEPSKPRGRPGPYEEERSMRAFMHAHFRAAYMDHPTANGRFGTEPIEGRGVQARKPVADIPRAGLCKSGDGCQRGRGHGRTGMFCEHHAQELARVDASGKLLTTIPGTR